MIWTCSPSLLRLPPKLPPMIALELGYLKLNASILSTKTTLPPGGRTSASAAKLASNVKLTPPANVTPSKLIERVVFIFKSSINSKSPRLEKPAAFSSSVAGSGL